MTHPPRRLLGLCLLFVGVMVAGRAAMSRPRDNSAAIRARAQLDKRRTTQLTPTRARVFAPSSQLTSDAQHTVRPYQAIPKQIRQRLEPRVQCVLKSLSANGRRGAATFDGDGTLWGGDVGEGFFQWMLRNRHYPEHRIPMLKQAWSGYRKGTLPGETMYELMVTGLAGLKESRVQQLAQQYFDTTHRHRIYRPSIDLIQALTSIGIEPWVVSGSPRWVVAAGAQHLGIPEARVIGLDVKVDRRGFLTSTVVRPVPWMHGKAKRIIQQVGRPPLLAAGNSYGDIQMLKTASELALVINPGPKVLKQARSLGWMIYHFTRRDELARSVRLLPAPTPPAGLLPAPTPPAGLLPAPTPTSTSPVLSRSSTTPWSRWALSDPGK